MLQKEVLTDQEKFRREQQVRLCSRGACMRPAVGLSHGLTKLVTQGKETTREWDLNDPNFLKNNPPPRTSDDPSAASVSGLQVPFAPPALLASAAGVSMRRDGSDV